ncbi:MAG: hypothetical protein JNK49_14445 [Planctomycetes bacterium]|nr:hypothetical protein [Planctomycetota bacterium]
MNFATRLGLSLAVLGTGFAVLLFLSSGAPGAAPAARTTRWESSQQCRPCHDDVFAEWQGSHHQISFTNPEVRALSDDFRREECKDCHLPRPLAVTGFGKRTLPRNTHLDEGVSCVSCHLGTDGGLVGRNDRPEVPCKPKRSEEFLSVDACASCHNQHGTTDQWRSSHFAAQGTDCAACHMPEVARTRPDKSSRMGRNHRFPGAHDPEMLKRAGRFEVRRNGSAVELVLTNVTAGHNFPTEERHRAVDFVYRFVGSDGTAGPWTLAFRCRNPYRDESTPVGPGAAPSENTQLPAGATKVVTVAIPADMRAVEARLWYRLTPFCDDQSPLSTLLEERRLELQ